MLVFGLLVAKTGTRVLEYDSDVGEYVHESPGFLYPFWLPLSYDVVRTPDYSFKFLAFGTILATTGFWVTLDALKEKRNHSKGDYNA